MNRRKKILSTLLITLTIIVVSLAGVFYIYVSDYCHADNTVVSSILNDANTIKGDNITVLETKQKSTTGFIFYPGSKIEAISYLPLLDLIRNKGITPFLVEMPFNLPILKPNAANAIIKDHPEIETWFIGGHDLGGEVASKYYAEHPDTLTGLVLLGATQQAANIETDSIIIYGSEDTIINRNKLSETDNIYIIQGGNHAQFGNYGTQSGDGVASITPIEQQVKTTNIIIEFINQQKGAMVK